MRWVITRGSSLKARFGRLGVHRSAVWSETHFITTGVTTWSTTLLDFWAASQGMGVFNADAKTVFLKG